MGATKVGRYMTSAPVTVLPKMTVSEALDIMEAHVVRHSPVVSEEGEIMGLLSEREVVKYKAFLDTRAIRVREIMAPHPYCVKQGTPLKEVLLAMESKRFGSAIVTSQLGEIMGIFTTTDALRILAELLGNESETEKSGFRYIEEFLLAPNASIV